MKGKIAYRFETPAYPGNIIYLNLVANYACTNDCLFCSRPREIKQRKENIYEKKAKTSLFLPKPPTRDEVVAAIDKIIKEDDEEFAIVGLGEPTINFELLKQVLIAIRERSRMKIRLDTNGLIRCTNKEACKILEMLLLDEIRISLNAINEEEYNVLCRPKFKNAFKELTKFIKECANSKIKTCVSFVTGFEKKGIKKRTKEEYFEFAKSLGIKQENIIMREYLDPI